MCMRIPSQIVYYNYYVWHIFAVSFVWAFSKIKFLIKTLLMRLSCSWCLTLLNYVPLKLISTFTLYLLKSCYQRSQVCWNETLLYEFQHEYMQQLAQNMGQMLLELLRISTIQHKHVKNAGQISVQIKISLAVWFSRFFLLQGSKMYPKHHVSSWRLECLNQVIFSARIKAVQTGVENHINHH